MGRIFDRPDKGQQGITLLELMVVCMLLSMALAIGLPAYTALLTEWRLTGATKGLMADISWAQAVARRGGQPVRVLIASDRRSYQVQVAADSDRIGGCTAPGYQTVRQVDLYGQFLVQVSRATYDCIPFDSSGRIAWAAPRVTFIDLPQNRAEGSLLAVNGRGAMGEIRSDPEVIRWIGHPLVRLEVDLGAQRAVEQFCPRLLAQVGPTPGETVHFPDLFRISVRNTNLDPWVEAAVVTVSPGIGSQCPSVSLTATRYAALELTPVGSLLALDEIEIADPIILLQTARGSGSRTIVITPVTGRLHMRP